MLLHDARRDACLDKAGEIVVLEEQDRRLWNQEQIAEALPMVQEAMRGTPDRFAFQAALAAVHCRAARADLLRRLGSAVEAAKSYRRALALVTNDSERRYLERRLREVQPSVL